MRPKRQFAAVPGPAHGARRRGFTLIELLVVIAVIALLMAILTPSLQRVRRQARAVKCQAQLSQWGILYQTYSAENDGYLPPEDSWSLDKISPADPWWAAWRWYWGGSSGLDGTGIAESPSFTAVRGILCCPMAAKWGYPVLLGKVNMPIPFYGGTFLAWTWSSRSPGEEISPASYLWYSSYGRSERAHSRSENISNLLDYYWMTDRVKNTSAIPVFLDSMIPCVYSSVTTEGKSQPPTNDAVPTRELRTESFWADCVCMNRHDGGINSLFMDWSVRKVGLKELWTLRWNPQFNTAGPWMKAGGIKPEDWPQWMRGFKDY